MVVVLRIWQHIRYKLTALEASDVAQQEQVAGQASSSQEGNAKSCFLWAGVQARLHLCKFTRHEAYQRLLNKFQMETIDRLVMKSHSLNYADRRKTEAWKQWTHAVRCMTFAARMLAPIRKHVEMEKVKAFLHGAWWGIQIQVAIRAFMTKVKRLQHSFKLSYSFMHIVRQRVLLPQVWAMESLVLAERVGICLDQVRKEVDEWLERHEVKRWTQKARDVAIARQQFGKVEHTGAMRSSMTSGIMHQLALHTMISQSAASDTTCLSVSPSNLSLQTDSSSGQPSQRQISGQSAATHASKRQTSPKRPSIRGKLYSSMASGAKGRSQVPGGVARLRKQHSGLSEKSGNSEVECPSLLKHVAHHRLTEQQRDHISQQIWRENTERWWRQYQSYKACQISFRVCLAAWKKDTLSLGMENRELRSDPPEFPKYPEEELFTAQPSMLRKYVTQALQQERGSSLLVH